MKQFPSLLFLFVMFGFSCSGSRQTAPEETQGFDMERDLLLVHYDCKTDVDDLQSVAAFASLLSNPQFSGIRFHAVAGTYGVQGGLYVPPNELFQQAFGDRWSDAHTDRARALAEVMAVALPVLKAEGEVFIADAGQSDFSAALVRKIMAALPDLPTTERIHIVQHSDWNQSVTSAEALKFVREHTHYQKIPDGNGLGNGTPGFRTEESIDLANFISDRAVLSTWQLAIRLCHQYNGQEGRYLNKAIAEGGLDFSDFSEVCWILGIKDVENSKDYFRLYVK